MELFGLRSASPGILLFVHLEHGIDQAELYYVYQMNKQLTKLQQCLDIRRPSTSIIKRGNCVPRLFAMGVLYCISPADYFLPRTPPIGNATRHHLSA